MEKKRISHTAQLIIIYNQFTGVYYGQLSVTQQIYTVGKSLRRATILSSSRFTICVTT